MVLTRDPADLTGAAATQYGILDATSVPISVGSEGFRPGETETVVDALIGYGLSGPLRGTAGELVEAIPEQSQTIVALDVPSGIDATTGAAPGPSITPDVTLTLALPKTGLADVPGRLVVGDIGIPAAVFERADIEYENPFDAYRVELQK